MLFGYPRLGGWPLGLEQGLEVLGFVADRVVGREVPDDIVEHEPEVCLKLNRPLVEILIYSLSDYY